MLAALLPGIAQAADSCVAPARPPVPHIDGPTERQPARVMPIGGYTLALIWQPQHCYNAARGAEDMTCSRALGSGPNRGFVLHGLWPDGEKGSWPQYCRPAKPLPAATLRRAWCATPSAQLLQHEWAKHGTCMDGDADAYFARAGALYRGLRFPDMKRLARRRDVTAGALKRAIVAANPRLRADMVRVRATDKGWLEEIWLCLDRTLAYRGCPVRDSGGDKRRLRISPQI